ncbi:MAG: sialidase family protein, partial [Ferruginibacter sp.]
MKNILIFFTISAMLLQGCNNHSAVDAVQLLSDTTHKASCESFTSDKDGRPVISWCENDNAGNKQFFFSHFDKEKNNFSERINIPIEKSTSLHEEGMPKLAIKNDGTIVAVYEVAAPTDKSRFAGNIKYIQSFDDGKSWTNPGFLHADTTAGESHSFAAISRLANGEIGASWLDVSFGTNKDGRSVKFATTNGHNGFSNEKLIDSFACQCCRTALSCDKKGNVSIMFRDLISDS